MAGTTGGIHSWLALTAATLFNRKKLAAKSMTMVWQIISGKVPRKTPRAPAAANWAGLVFSVKRVLRDSMGRRTLIFSPGRSLSATIFRWGIGVIERKV